MTAPGNDPHPATSASSAAIVISGSLRGPRDSQRGSSPTDGDFASLGSVNLDAGHVIERCIAARHVCR